jgi:flagellar biosynthesis protein FlhF
MKIKRYFAPDIKQAIRMVREEQGPDAVILSNRKVDGGVEIVAARDFDEQSMMDQWPSGASAQTREPSLAQAGEAAVRKDSQRRADEAFREATQALRQTPTQPNSPPRSRPQAQSRAETVAKPPSTPVRPQTAPVENPSNGMLTEMRKEMQQMRRMLDAHCALSAWDNSLKSAPARLDLLRNLSERGFSKKIALQLANRLGGVADFSLAWQGCQDLIGSQLPIIEDNLLDYGGIVALVGPTGVGKTTTIAKLAARFRLKHGPRQVALITTDNYRIGAHDQLTTYGRILDVPVRSAADAGELRSLLNGFCDKRLVLIDTAGMGPKDLRLAEQLAVLRQDEIPVKSYLVLSAATQARVMEEAIAAFGAFDPKACILTKLDEAGQLGAAISVLIEKRLPVSLVTDGQQVPEDLHLARTHLLLDQCFADRADGRPDLEGFESYGYEDWVAYANV